jgi:citrate lyase subunit beta/citryl-CoA lyase
MDLVEAASGPAPEASRPDALMLDLHDLVAASKKDEARANLRSFLEAGPTTSTFVRIASPDLHEPQVADLEAAIRPGLAGVILPDWRQPEEVRTLDSSVSALESERGLPAGSIAIILMLENALAIRNLYEGLTASPRSLAAWFGSAPGGDLCRDIGYRWSPEGTEYLYMRSKVVVDARAAGINHILDTGGGPWLSDIEGFERDTKKSRSLGYTGRFLHTAEQVEVANRLYRSSDEEIQEAEGVLAAWREAERRQIGMLHHEGKVIDIATAKHAEKVLARAGRSLES